MLIERITTPRWQYLIAGLSVDFTAFFWVSLWFLANFPKLLFLPTEDFLQFILPCSLYVVAALLRIFLHELAHDRELRRQGVPALLIHWHWVIFPRHRSFLPAVSARGARLKQSAIIQVLLAPFIPMLLATLVGGLFMFLAITFQSLALWCFPVGLALLPALAPMVGDVYWVAQVAKNTQANREFEPEGNGLAVYEVKTA